MRVLFVTSAYPEDRDDARGIFIQRIANGLVREGIEVVIHAHWIYPAGIAGLVAARRRRVPLVITSHGGDLNLARGSRVLRSLSARVARTADACVAVSDDLASQFRSLGVAQQRIS